jgi:Zn-finger nucleic acid-binding protein
MKCPACEGSLQQVKAGDVELDCCTKGCGGVWFDWLELKKFDEPHEFDLSTLTGIPAYSAQRITKTGVRYCPKCNAEELIHRSYDIQDQVEIDQCLKCSGIWLDAGELESIRKQYPTEAERRNAGDAWLDTQLTAHKREMTEHTAGLLHETSEDVLAAASDNVIPSSRLTWAVYSVLGFFKHR